MAKRFIPKETMERNLRRYRNLLVVVGSGVILFGLWSAIRAVAMPLVAQELFWEDIGPRPNDTFELVLVYVITYLWLAVDLIIRAYIGRCAIAEGMRRHRKNGLLYLFLAALLALACLLYTILAIHDLFTAQVDLVEIPNLVVSLILEATSTVTIIEMLFSVLMVRGIERNLARLAAARRDPVL